MFLVFLFFTLAVCNLLPFCPREDLLGVRVTHMEERRSHSVSLVLVSV
jgi:hypothetical protein